ncbi:MAG: hypothetical protein JSS25_00745 [Proteobacteria bacterium]|nr:hypothetical protein [Pseudomonadota bacterium]
MRYSLLLVLAACPCIAWACSPGSRLAFSCDLDNAKRVEICQKPDSLTYAYGKPGQKPEMTFEVTNKQAFDVISSGSGGGSDYLVLPNGKTMYVLSTDVVYERTYGNGDKTKHEEHKSLSAWVNRKAVASHQCTKVTNGKFSKNIPSHLIGTDPRDDLITSP